jgi:hypothetical protein
MFANIMQKKLGIPKSNSFVLLDKKATQGNIKNRFRIMLRRVAKGDKIYFYYNGHGIPVPNLKNEPFMLASDSYVDFISDEKFFSLKNIYSMLSNSKASKVVAFVDSCFSGATDAKTILKGVAATRLIPKRISFNKKKMVVITAGKDREFSNGYDKTGYRLFSYFLMKNILKGDTSIKKLYSDTKRETYKTSIREFGDLRVQHPTIDGNYNLGL